MKKLSLKPDELRAESFEPVTGPAALRGTVAGHDDPTMGVTCICQTDDEPTCRRPTCPPTACDC